MIRCRNVIAFFALALILAACSTTPPTWRTRASLLVEDLARQGAPRLLPREYGSLLETFEHGEAVFHVQQDELQADQFYLLTLQKGAQVSASLRRLHELQVEEQRRLEVEREARAEEERLMREAEEAEARLKEEQRAEAEKAEHDDIHRPVVERKHIPKTVTSYTVRRGETLPQIAGRAEVYNNSSLWPLIYRANRDQIRDPKRLWPGQVLSIPRN